MGKDDYQIFSEQLPQHEAVVAANSLSPAQRQALITAFARKFRMTEADAQGALQSVQQQTGYLPSLKNLQQSDVGWGKAKGSDVFFSHIDNGFANAFGNSYLMNKAPALKWVAPMQWGFAAVGSVANPAGKVINKGVDAVAGKNSGVGDFTKNVVTPVATYGTGYKALNAAKNAVSKMPSTSTVGRIGSTVGKAGKVLGTVGSGLDIADAVINTGRDIGDIFNGAKKQRYTDETINALGRGATPWEAFKYYRMAKTRDTAVDTAKLAAIALTKGHTGGLVSALGGSRLHLDEIPVIPGLVTTGTVYDSVKDLYTLIKPGRQGAIDRRVRAYKYRDGFWNGLLKTHAGNYFNYERDHVMNQIKRERKAFDNSAKTYLQTHNPMLYKRLANVTNAKDYARLMRERDKWLKSTKFKGKTFYDRALKDSGANPDTL